LCDFVDLLGPVLAHLLVLGNNAKPVRVCVVHDSDEARDGPLVGVAPSYSLQKTVIFLDGDDIGGPVYDQGLDALRIVVLLADLDRY
jgi:hypothetical protein